MKQKGDLYQYACKILTTAIFFFGDHSLWVFFLPWSLFHTSLIAYHLQRIRESENWFVLNRRYYLRWAFNKKDVIWNIKDKTPTIFIMY